MTESEKQKVQEKRDSLLAAIQNLSDGEILNNDNFTFWGRGKKITSNSHDGNGNPPTPPPPPPPPPGQ